MKICFLDKTIFEYDDESLYSSNLRGAESVLINLSKALSKQGHNITIINNCPKNKIKNKIRWINYQSNFNVETYDLVISNGDCRMFKFAKSNRYLLFSHSIQSIEKFLRKNQLFSYLKYKPRICFLSEYHKKKRSKLLYLFGNINIEWSVDEIFLKAPMPSKLDNKFAIFPSKENRNQNLLIKVWKEFIFKENNELKLLLNYKNENLEKFNIFNRNQSSQNDLLNELSRARVFLIPGHQSELFCLAAAEARQMCIPIVTLGLGCLSERVEHGKTGFIAKNLKQFSDYTIQLFENDKLWNSMREYLFLTRSKSNWDLVAKKLINQLNV